MNKLKRHDEFVSDKLKVKRRFFCILFILAFYGIIYPGSPDVIAQDFKSSWPGDISRVWAGPEYWANRLQDWRIHNGRLECVTSDLNKPLRTVHLLTRRLGDSQGDLFMSVRTGPVVGGTDIPPEAAAGFLFGAGSELDYRAAALVHHTPGTGGGIAALMESTGRAVIRDMSVRDFKVLASAGKIPESPPEEAELRLEVRPSGDMYDISFLVCEPETGNVLSRVALKKIQPSRLTGSLALISHPGVRDKNTARKKPGTAQKGARYWFRDWFVSGSKVEVHNDRMCGPVISAQHTLSGGIIKMTAQLMPVAENDSRDVVLQIKKGGLWKTAASAGIVVPGYTATFRVENWDSSIDTPYRVVYRLKQADGSDREYIWPGTVRRDPVDKSSIVVAAFTGNHNVAHPGVERGIPWTPDGVWFPHNDIAAHVAAHKPDLLFFSGDNVYEGDSPTVPVKSPVEEAHLDYLYKWYLWCWAFGDLARTIPCITVPDDHDVYQGNIWGAGGRKTDVDNRGGYVMPAEWVRMVERTQTSNLPDPYDPTPVEQGIDVYYTGMKYGRIGFAIIEDRKFKSGCAGLVPDTGGRPDHITDPDFDPRTADVPGAKLLGDRQLVFLEDWANDWQGVDMKAVLSQTVFANVATHHGANLMYLVADYDSNGWPQTGRNRALHEIRRAFAFMIGGDQHLSTIVHHGIDNFNDAGWSFCVPSIANFYPRAWNPLKPAVNRLEGMPEYTGEFLDGLGNHVTVWAATNPGKKTGKNPARLHDNMPGYGIVRFIKPDRTITMECWPRYVDPENPDTGGQYSGWPRTIDMEDNYSREAEAYLPSLRFTGMENPVIQVIDEADGEVVYTLRIKGTGFRPKVFREGLYTIRAGEPGTQRMKILKNIRSLKAGESKELNININ